METYRIVSENRNTKNVLMSGMTNTPMFELRIIRCRLETYRGAKCSDIENSSFEAYEEGIKTVYRIEQE